jgi:hypothetical protein
MEEEGKTEAETLGEDWRTTSAQETEAESWILVWTTGVVIC